MAPRAFQRSWTGLWFRPGSLGSGFVTDVAEKLEFLRVDFSTLWRTLQFGGCITWDGL